jgi:hypothetical protein
MSPPELRDALTGLLHKKSRDGHGHPIETAAPIATGDTSAA